MQVGWVGKGVQGSSAGGGVIAATVASSERFSQAHVLPKARLQPTQPRGLCAPLLGH